MAASDFIVTPPSVTRERESSADAKTVEGMAKAFRPGSYVSNGKTYKTHKAAQNDSAVYRRAFARALYVEPHKIKTRIWGDRDGVIVLDRTKSADWRFGLTVDPDRQKRTRNRNGNS